MKKVLAISLLVVMLVMGLTTVAHAATSAELAAKIYEKASAYGLTSADKVKMERYLSENPVTDAQADKVLTQVDEAVKVMKDAGVTDYNKLTDAQKTSVKNIAQKAATEVDLKLEFNGTTVAVYNKEGKKVDTITNQDGKLVYTGNNVNVVLVVSVIAIIALAITVVAKRTNNAK